VAERVLTLRELNRATLARQLLLERRRLPLVRAVERLGGLQAQSAPAPYVGLWTRLEGFRRDALERALRRHELLRAVVMRGTIHLISRADYGLMNAALRVAPPRWAKAEAHALAERLADPLHMFCQVPRTRADISEWLRDEHGLDGDEPPGFWYALRILGRVPHAPESGTWKPPQTTTYFSLHHEPKDEVPAREALVRRYLAAFGPATRADIAEWSGLRVRDFEPMLQPLRRFRDEQGRELLDLPRAPLPSADTPAPVRLLPRFDNLVLAHADRRRVIADEHRKAVIHGGGIVEATILVDGVVSGTWRVEKGRVRLEPFAPLPRTARAEVDAEAARLEAWLR